MTHTAEAARIRLLLTTQRNALIHAERTDSSPSAKTIAKRYVAMIDARLRWDDDALRMLGGQFGENGWAPAIADIEAQLEYRHQPEGMAA